MGAALALSSFGLSRGSSAAAQFIDSESERRWNALQETYSLGMAGKGVIRELEKLWDDFRQPNWDGYGAVPLSANSYSLAAQFLRSLPLRTPPPSIGAEPDGHVTAEWYSSPRKTFSLSFSPDGYIHFALLHALKRTWGTEPFSGTPSHQVLRMIQEIVAA